MSVIYTKDGELWRYVDENLRMLATEVEKACFSDQPRSRLNLGSALQSVKALMGMCAASRYHIQDVHIVCGI